MCAPGITGSIGSLSEELDVSPRIKICMRGLTLLYNLHIMDLHKNPEIPTPDQVMPRVKETRDIKTLEALKIEADLAHLIKKTRQFPVVKTYSAACSNEIATIVKAALENKGWKVTIARIPLGLGYSVSFTIEPAARLQKEADQNAPAPRDDGIQVTQP